MVALIHIALDTLGPHFVFDPTFAPIIGQTVQWFIQTQIPSQLDKKTVIKSLSCLKIFVAILRANSTGLSAASIKLN